MILAVSLGAAALVALTYGFTDFMMRVALDREPPRVLPRLMRIVQGWKTGDDPYAGLDGLGEALRNKSYETVIIHAHDGVALCGHWIPCDNPQRVILAVHGWRSTWYRDFGGIADFWNQNGCSVLYIDQRGQQGSGGEQIGFGMLECEDVPDWVAWINERCGAHMPVYLAGISMGATTVLMASALELPPNVCGILADCGFTSPDAIWRHIVKDNFHMPYALLGYFADRICRRKIGMSSKARSTVDALKGCQIPVLFFHGEADTFVPVEMSYENHVACASKNQLLVVPSAVHGLSYLVQQQRYETAEIQFWNEYDLLSQQVERGGAESDDYL